MFHLEMILQLQPLRWVLPPDSARRLADTYNKLAKEDRKYTYQHLRTYQHTKYKQLIENIIKHIIYKETSMRNYKILVATNCQKMKFNYLVEHSANI